MKVERKGILLFQVTLNKIEFADIERHGHSFDLSMDEVLALMLNVSCGFLHKSDVNRNGQ